jgi:CBS domain containing-hemolysin-like protein
LLILALLLFLLEWLVEWSISRAAEVWAFRLSSFGRILIGLTYPLIAVLMRISGEPITEPEGAVTEAELISLVEAGQQDGVLEQDEHKMIVSIIRLGDTLVREIMIPRIAILALDVNTPIEQAADALIKSGHSRVPVYDDSVDTVLGLLYAKDLLRVWREGNQIGSLQDLLREAYFVPEAKKVDELLEELQARRIHIAIVVDEFGGVAGLVTMEDIVEEIVGEIRDEYDQSEELLVQAINENEYVFHGRIDLDDFNDLLGTVLPKSEADTLGGYIFNHIGRVPAVGDKFQVDPIELTIEQISGQSIRKVRAQRITPLTQNGVNEPHVDG